MTEPVIICPNCKAEIKLTESLAAHSLRPVGRTIVARGAASRSNASPWKPPRPILSSSPCLFSSPVRANEPLSRPRRRRTLICPFVNRDASTPTALCPHTPSAQNSIQPHSGRLNVATWWNESRHQRDECNPWNGWCAAPTLGRRHEITRLPSQGCRIHLKSARAAIATAEAKKAREALADELAQAAQEKAATDTLLKYRDGKLAEVRKLRDHADKVQEVLDVKAQAVSPYGSLLESKWATPDARTPLNKPSGIL